MVGVSYHREKPAVRLEFRSVTKRRSLKRRLEEAIWVAKGLKGQVQGGKEEAVVFWMHALGRGSHARAISKT